MWQEPKGGRDVEFDLTGARNLIGEDEIPPGLMRTLRIFISSPGDVQEERQVARRVIADLQKRYGEEALLRPVLWEDLPLQPDLSFQQAIDLILSERGVDIAIFVLWSRLGSEVAGITKPDGSAYRSGTEREFDLMMAARQSSPEEARRPDILVYTRRDDETFTDALDSSKGTLQLRELIEQKSLAENFIRENFIDDRGRNLRAFHTFPKPVDFASRLKVHLIELLDEKLAVSGKAVWQGNPYRGLQSFQAEHAPVFFGRERDSDELAALLRARERDPADACAFACIVGASGSGKSSLVRAGLAPDLLHSGPEDAGAPGVAVWRFLALTPSDLVPDLPSRLIDALAGPFPDLVRNTTRTDLAEALRDSPKTFLKLSLRPAIQAECSIEVTCEMPAAHRPVRGGLHPSGLSKQSAACRSPAAAAQDPCDIRAILGGGHPEVGFLSCRPEGTGLPRASRAPQLRSPATGWGGVAPGDCPTRRPGGSLIRGARQQVGVLARRSHPRGHPATARCPAAPSVHP